MIILFLDENTNSGSVESSSAIEPVTEVLKDADVISQSQTSPNTQGDNVLDINEGIGMGTRDSDDESLSISLPSNGEDTDNLKLDTHDSATGKQNDKNNSIRNSLRKQILRILSTDDEDETDFLASKNQTEQIR